MWEQPRPGSRPQLQNPEFPCPLLPREEEAQPEKVPRTGAGAGWLKTAEMYLLAALEAAPSPRGESPSRPLQLLEALVSSLCVCVLTWNLLPVCLLFS